MGRWIEVPTHYVLEVEYNEFHRDFERLDENGAPITHGEYKVTRLIRRNRDGRVFRAQPRYHAADRDGGKLIYLEEL